MTRGDMLDCLRYNLEDLKLARGSDYSGVEAIEMAIKTLEAPPEIVRCKDCRHLKKWRSEESAKKFGQIYECVKGVLRDPVPEDFCSRAERRT